MMLARWSCLSVKKFQSHKEVIMAPLNLPRRRALVSKAVGVRGSQGKKRFLRLIEKKGSRETMERF